MAFTLEQKINIYNALTEKGIPLHPVKKRSKGPLFKSWTSESTRYKIEKNSSGVSLSQVSRLPDGSLKSTETIFESDFEIGAKAGASIGIAHDNYLCFLDIDLPDEIEKDATGKIKNKDTVSVIAKELDELKNEFCRISKIPKSSLILERSGGKHRGFHIPFISPLPLLSLNNAVIYTDKQYLKTFDIYAYNKDFGVKNLIIAPSHGNYPYTIYNNNRAVKTEESFIDVYTKIPRLSFTGWYNLTTLYKEEDIRRNQFALLNRAVLPSANINYELFGGIYSGMAAHAGLDEDVYHDMVDYALSQLGSPKRDTVENIHKYIKTTYEKFDKSKLNPRGVPSLREHIKDIWKNNRAIESDDRLKEELDVFCNLVSLTLEYKKRSKKHETFESTMSKGYVSKSDMMYDRYTKELLPGEYDETQISNLMELFKNQGAHLKPNRVIINGLCDAGNIIIYGAAPGTGKSVSLIDGMYHASKGELVWDSFVVDRPLRVLYLYADKDASDFENKYIKNYTGDIKSNPNFRVLYADDLRASNIKPDLSDPSARVALKNICNNFKPDILIFDTFKTWFPTFNENDTVESNSIYEIFLKFTRDHQCCAFLITHTPKSKADNYSNAMYHAAKGAGALVDRATAVAYITQQHDERNKPMKNKNFISFPKTGVKIIPPFKFEIVNTESYNVDKNETVKKYSVTYQESSEEEFMRDQNDSKTYRREIKIVRAIKDNPLPMSALAKLLGVPAEMSYRHALRQVAEVEGRGLIKKEGSRRGAAYSITREGELFLDGKIKEYLEEQENNIIKDFKTKMLNLEAVKKGEIYETELPPIPECLQGAGWSKIEGVTLEESGTQGE